MNDIRDRILGSRSPGEPLLRSKKRGRSAPSTAAEDESFADVPITREAVRVANHRDGDRHRLDSQHVEILHDGRWQEVTLINLSGGGAMIEGAGGLKLWDRLELRLCEWGSVDAAVRWIRGGRFGLEFAEETRVDGAADDVARMLQAVRDRSQSGLAVEAADAPQEQDVEAPAPEDAEGSDSREEVSRELRHPLIWSGLIHYDHETIPVRIRNISAGGALIECGHSLKVGSELLLELDKAGSFFASVIWGHGDAAGLQFLQPFDLQHLASAQATVAAARWVTPDHLRDSRATSSPWLKQWGRKG